MYIVTDSYGHFLRKFPTYKQAMTFCLSRGRMDWHIKSTNYVY